MISIVVPIFNTSSYIELCLNSIVNQSYKQQVECLLIDDCGTDDSIEIAQRTIRDYVGNVDFRIIRHDMNKGLSAARNTGIREAKGDWILFLDSDDWLYPDCLKSMVRILDKYPDSDVIVSSAASDNEWVQRESLVDRTDIPDTTVEREWIMNGVLSRPVLFPLSAWNKLYSRRFIVNNKLSFLEGYVREDEIWSFHWSKYVRRVSFNKTNTYFYRKNENGIVNSNDKYNSPSFLMDIASHYLDNVTELGKDIQLRLIATMLVDAFINSHNDADLLKKNRILLGRLEKLSYVKGKIGCFIFRYVHHHIVCKRPVFFFLKRKMFGINK